MARSLADANISGIVSFAGRVDRPVRQPLPQRIGGFGGVHGLASYLTETQVTHVVDATHPFAARMSKNAIAACAQRNVPMVALSRRAWRPQQGDTWHHVDDIAAAVSALNRPAARVMLAVGRMHLAEFAPNLHHFYLLRLVDPPRAPLPFENAKVIVSRGPFTHSGDLNLMRKHNIDLVVSKNSGGTGAYAKITAARALNLPVIMIERPTMPDRIEFGRPDEILAWITHGATDRGV